MDSYILKFPEETKAEHEAGMYAYIMEGSTCSKETLRFFGK